MAACRTGPAPFICYARYDRYTPVELLHEGENVIGVLGCYYGNPTGDCIPYTGGGMVFQGELTLSGGRTVVVGSDESWRCKPATCWFPPITRRSGWRSLIEWYDARWYPEHWHEPGFDDSAWLPVNAASRPLTAWVEGGEFSDVIGYIILRRRLAGARGGGRSMGIAATSPWHSERRLDGGPADSASPRTICSCHWWSRSPRALPTCSRLRKR